VLIKTMVERDFARSYVKGNVEGCCQPVAAIIMSKLKSVIPDILDSTDSVSLA